MLVKPTTFLPVAWLVLLLPVNRVDAQYRPYRLASVDQRAATNPVRLPSARIAQASGDLSAPVDASTSHEQPGDEATPIVPAGIQSTPVNGETHEHIQPKPMEDGHLMHWGSEYNQYLSPYVTRPDSALQGFFFQWDQLIWSLANRPDIGPIGNPEAEGWVSTGNQTVGHDVFFLVNEMNTDVYSGRVHSGQRFEFGHSDCGNGWFSSISFGSGVSESVGYGVNFLAADPLGLLDGFQDLLDENGNPNPDGYDDDIDGDRVFGRSGRDTGVDGIPDIDAPTDLDDAGSWVISFDQLHVRDVFEFSGAELNRSIDRSPNLQWFYGIRYADFREHFSLTGSGGALSPFELSTSAKNQIIGPQFGMRYNQAFYKFILNVEGRFLPGYNYQSATQRGHLTLRGSSGPAAWVGPNIRRTVDNDEFSAVGEWRVSAILPINRFAAFRFGYTGFVMSGISYASPKVVYQLPSFGVSDVSSNETILVSAFTVGLEINR